MGIVLIHIYLLGLLGASGIAYKLVDAETEGLVYPVCVMFAALTVWCFWSWWRYTGQMLDPYCLFLLAAVLFNGGQAFLELLQANPEGILGGAFSPPTLVRSLYFTMWGLASVHLGALIGTHILRRRQRAQVPPRGSARLRTTAFVGLAMVAISFLPWFLVLRQSITAVMSYGYFVGLFNREAATGFGATASVVGAFLIPGALFILAGSRRSPIGRVFAITIIATYGSVHLVLGSRAPAITVLFASLWLWHRNFGPVRKRTLVAVCGVVAVMLPFVVAIRDLNMDARSAVTFTEVVRTVKNPFVSTVAEMGNSLSTVAYTMDLVPAIRPFDFGRSYLFAGIAALPNLFWDVHPTVARGLLGTWLVWSVDPHRAANNSGLGFSFLAEAYLNFGWLGGLVALVLVGMLLGSLAHWAGTIRDPACLAATASIMTFLLVYARGESASVVRGILWYSALPYLTVRLLTWPQRGRGAATGSAK